MARSELRADEGFDTFYERHWRRVYGICMTYMKNPADAEDCTEDVFVKVLTGNYEFTDELHEIKWLTVTAANLCKDRLRHWWNGKVSPIDEAAEIPAENSDSEYDDVISALRSLPEKHREVILMYYYTGLSTEEIALRLRVPASTARNRLRDARNKLKDILENDDL